MVKKNRKIFLSLGLAACVAAFIPMLAISCEASQKRKLRSALSKNKKLRKTVLEKTNYDGYTEFEKKIYDELNTKLLNISDKTEREKIYKEILQKVYTSNDNLTSMKDSIN